MAKQQTGTSAYAYDVVVAGAGHAGCEAALAAARIGCRTLLVTMNMDLIGHMPCNPSIGGPGKAHLVREIDALGGAMARNTDMTLIQIRMLNESRGPAVQALRAQADKRLYSLRMKHVIESAPNLDLEQGQIIGLLAKDGRIRGVVLERGEQVDCRAVVLASGTFLNGRILEGEFRKEAGRAGEFPAHGLTASLRELGFEVGRLQTNTPPRVDARTVHFERTRQQYGSDVPLYFSFDRTTEGAYTLPINPVLPIDHQTIWRQQVPCYLTATNERTHKIIRDNMHRSPIGSGVTEGEGPRYCPSIEEKIMRFPEKLSHHLFLEPEGFATGEIYVQGCFTGMPADVQREMLHSVPGLEDARIMRPGYAIDYDFVPPHQIKPSLETRRCAGLFLAGQINGTSGYEEAASQGLLAGANAALYCREEEPLVLGREEAYLGVLVDDLITKEHHEPYRMLTSRAEYRLLLRQDNADVRLKEEGKRTGLISEAQYARAVGRQQAVENEITRLEGIRISPRDAMGVLEHFGLDELHDGVSARQLLSRPGMTYDVIEALCPPEQPMSDDLAEQVCTDILYAGYVAKQQRQVERTKRLETMHIPEDVDYAAMQGLRTEARERLIHHRPLTLGQASRISGVNPADVSVLLIHLEKLHRSKR